MNRRIVKTEAVVLKRMDYLESSRIVTLFTLEEGKVSVLAKGARAKNNRFGAALEPGAVVQVVYYTKPNRELQTLTQTDVLERFRGITESMATLTGALHVLDLAHAVTDPGHKHPELYQLLVAALRAVHTHPVGLPAVLLGFRLKLSHVSGLTPGITSCVQCGRDVDPVPASGHRIFDVRRGGVLCGSCSGHSSDDRREPPSQGAARVRMKADRFDMLSDLMEREFSEYRDVILPSGMWNELDSVLRLYEKYHLLHGRTLKTDAMVREFIA